MTTVLLGNSAPMIQKDDTSVLAPHISASVTRVELRPDFDDSAEAELALSTNNDRILSMIGRGLSKADKKYALGVLEIEHLMVTHSAATPSWVSCEDPEFQRVLAKHFGCPQGEPVALLTNAGRDAVHAQHMSTSAQPASFNYLALSANTTAASAASTTLPGEIVTAGGGLIRGIATYAHTAGTNTSTLTRTFTANGSDALPVTVAKIGY